MVYLKPFLDSIETGFIQVSDTRRQQVPSFGYRPEQGGSRGSKEKSGLSLSSLKTKLSRKQPQDSETELQHNTREESRALGNIATAGAVQHEWDAHSRSHILQTTTLIVQEGSREDYSLPTSPAAQAVHYPGSWM